MVYELETKNVENTAVGLRKLFTSIGDYVLLNYMYMYSPFVDGYKIRLTCSSTIFVKLASCIRLLL